MLRQQLRRSLASALARPAAGQGRAAQARHGEADRAHAGHGAQRVPRRRVPPPHQRHPGGVPGARGQAVRRAQRRGARQGHGGDPHAGRLHDRPGARGQADDARAVQRHGQGGAGSRQDRHRGAEPQAQVDHREHPRLAGRERRARQGDRQRVHPRHHRPDDGGAEVALPDVPVGAGVPRCGAPGHGREHLGFHAQRAAGRQHAAAQEDLRDGAPALPRERAGRPRRQPPACRCSTKTIPRCRT